MSSWQSFFAFFNGLIAGCSQVLVMQPFEIIKIRLQTQTLGLRHYNGIEDCFMKILVNQGPLAFYKGTLTPLIGVGILGSLRFGLYENVKFYLASKQKIEVNQLGLSSKIVSALVTGAATSFFMCPIEHTRIRIQIQRNQAERIYTGSIDAGIKITKKYGIKGLFRGQGPSTVREATGLVFYFTSIQLATQALSSPGVSKKDLPFYVPLVAGGIAGIAYWMFNYPFDYVKTLMQTDQLGKYKYPNMLSCFKNEYKKFGINVFYKGFTICMLRSVPVNAAGLFMYRLMQRISQVSSN